MDVGLFAAVQHCGLLMTESHRVMHERDRRRVHESAVEQQFARQIDETMLTLMTWLTIHICLDNIDIQSTKSIRIFMGNVVETLLNLRNCKKETESLSKLLT